MADNNYLQRLPLPAPRGVLFDRRHSARRQPEHHQHRAAREQTKTIDRTLRILATATGVNEAQLAEEVRRRRREPSYRPIVLIENARFEQVAAFRARQLELPGIIQQDVPSRKYTASDLAAHLFGYVGEVRRRSFSGQSTRGSRREPSSVRRASSSPTTSC